MMFLILQLLTYGWLAWVAFGVTAFCAARFGGGRGVIAGHVLLAVAVFVLDVQWIRAEMKRPDWDPSVGPDQDIVFMVGVVLRVVMINWVLVPVSLWGLWLRRRSESRRGT